MSPPGAGPHRWIGLDGARGGWAAAALTDDGAGELHLVPTVAAALSRWPEAECVFIDMPLGLPSGADRRRCDTLARQLLPGRRSSSIFTPPCRQALAAPDHAAATRINRRVTGRGLSIQAWHLCPRILEVDGLLRERPELRHLVLEAHPELLFTLLSTERDPPSGPPPLPSKRSAEGTRRRREILEKLVPHANELLDSVQVLRRDAAPDDWVDALVLAAVARRTAGRPARLPEPPEVDEHGIPMALAIPEQIPPRNG